MQPSLDRTISTHLATYLAGEYSLDEFKDWLVGATRDIEHDNQSDATRLAYRIKHRLAEHSGGHLTEDQLKHLLRSHVDQYTARV